jgi:hypothetical protein
VSCKALKAQPEQAIHFKLTALYILGKMDSGFNFGKQKSFKKVLITTSIKQF